MDIILWVILMVILYIVITDDGEDIRSRAYVTNDPVMSATIKVIEAEFAKLHEEIGSDSIKLKEWDEWYDSNNKKSFYDTDVVDLLEELEKAIKLNIRLIGEA